MGRERIFGDLHLVGEDDFVDKVEIITFDGEFSSGKDLGRGEFIDRNGLAVGESGFTGDSCAVLESEHGEAGLGSLLRHGYANLGMHSGSDHFDFGDDIVSRNSHGHHILEVGSDETKLSAANHGLRAIGLKHDGIGLKLLGAEFIRVAGKRQQ